MLKQLTANLLIAVSILTPAMGQQGQAPTQTIRIRKNTTLKFATTRALDSTTSKVGEDVPLRLVNALVVDGVTLLPAGEMVHSRISKVKRANAHCGDGEVQLKLEPLSFADSSSAMIKLWYTSSDPDAVVPEKYVRNWEAYDIADSVLEGIFWSPVLVIAAPLMLFSQCDIPGKEYTLPENATVAVLITQDHKVRY